MAEEAGEAKSAGIDRKTFYLSIVASVVASIVFAVFFEKITSVVTDVTYRGISLVYVGFVNDSYSKATGAVVEYMLFLLVMFVILLVCSFPLSYVIYSIAKAVLTFLNKKRAGRHITTATLSYRDRRLRAEKLFQRSAIIGALTVPFQVVTLSSTLNTIQIKATFDRDMMALSPYLTADERNRLARQWALMKTKKDFEVIMETIQGLSLKYRAELPSEFPRLY